MTEVDASRFIHIEKAEDKECDVVLIDSKSEFELL